jgi:hypothetical protein
MSLRLSSSRYWNESSGMSTGVVPMFNHDQRAAKRRQVASSLGREEYQGLVLLAASKVAPLFGDIRPRVSMEMRRISMVDGGAAKTTVKKTWEI